MTLATMIGEVLNVFNGLPADYLLAISATAVVSAGGYFVSRIVRAVR
ncbi:MAG: hypothetical protein AAF846_11140 [Chloroflexota bacterium]